MDSQAIGETTLRLQTTASEHVYEHWRAGAGLWGVVCGYGAGPADIASRAEAAAAETASAEEVAAAAVAAPACEPRTTAERASLALLASARRIGAQDRASSS